MSEITTSVQPSDEEYEVNLFDFERDHLCAHVFHDGAFCNEVAMAHMRYCRWHTTAADRLARRTKYSRSRHKNAVRDLLIPTIDDAYSHQVAIQEVMDAIIDGRIDTRRAAHLLYALQLAQNNIQSKLHLSHYRFTEANLESHLKDQDLEQRQADQAKASQVLTDLNPKKPPQRQSARIEKTANSASAPSTS